MAVDVADDSTTVVDVEVLGSTPGFLQDPRIAHPEADKGTDNCRTAVVVAVEVLMTIRSLHGVGEEVGGGNPAAVGDSTSGPVSCQVPALPNSYTAPCKKTRFQLVSNIP